MGLDKPSSEMQSHPAVGLPGEVLHAVQELGLAMAVNVTTHGAPMLSELGVKVTSTSVGVVPDLVAVIPVGSPGAAVQ
jgi:hypothetical protein